MQTASIPLGAGLTEQQARDIYADGEEAIVFAMLASAKMLADQRTAVAGVSHQATANSSGIKPPHAKPAPPKRGKKRPGSKTGYPDSKRPPPECKAHRADSCPDCGNQLKRWIETRTRYTEDIPEKIEPVVTEHTIRRD